MSNDTETRNEPPSGLQPLSTEMKVALENFQKSMEANIPEIEEVVNERLRLANETRTWFLKC
jgi:hypothetical protein